MSFSPNAISEIHDTIADLTIALMAASVPLKALPDDGPRAALAMIEEARDEVTRLRAQIRALHRMLIGAADGPPPGVPRTLAIAA